MGSPVGLSSVRRSQPGVEGEPMRGLRAAQLVGTLATMSRLGEKEKTASGEEKAGVPHNAGPGDCRTGVA